VARDSPASKRVDLRLLAEIPRKVGVTQRETRDGDVVSLDANVATEADGFNLPEHRLFLTSLPRHGSPVLSVAWGGDRCLSRLGRCR